MRKKLLPPAGFLMIVLLLCSYHPAVKVNHQNNNYLVTMEGIGSLRLHMSLAEVENLLQAKVPLKYIGNGGYGDTIPVKYKEVDLLLYLDGDNRESASLRGIETKNDRCRTASGLGTGSDKMSVIRAYPDHLKYVAPEYETYPVRSNTRSAVAVMDTIGTSALVFHIIAKKVVSVEVHSFYEFY